MTGWCGFEQLVGVDSEVTRLPAECGKSPVEPFRISRYGGPSAHSRRNRGVTMAQTTAILYVILSVITVCGGLGVITAIIAMAKSSYRD